MDFVDLSAGSDDEPIGIYLFCDESGKCRYVGNNGSRCFVERIAAHLDFRERAFMSHLIKVLRTKKNSAGNVEIAAQIGCLNLLLVSGIPKEKIGKVERILKRLLEPDLNNLRIGHRKLAENELDRTLANLVS